MTVSSSPNLTYHHLNECDPDDKGDGRGDGPTRNAAAAHDDVHTTKIIPVDRSQHTQRRLAVSLLSICSILLFADQNLMSPNLSAIADYFGFNDEERDRKLGGDIALAFFVLGAPASYLIGCLADYHDRTQLFAATIFAGEGACLATYWVTTYTQLYMCRAITGLSVGGALPLIYSILGDMYAAEERHTVSSYIGIGTGIGISLGQGVAGFLGPTYGWQTPFLVISVPSLLCATAFLLLVSDPERGGMEQAVIAHRQQLQQEYANHPLHQLPFADRASSLELPQIRHRSRHDQCDDEELQDNAHEIPSTLQRFNLQAQWQTFLLLLSTPTLVLALLQGAPGCVPWGIVNTYLNDYLAADRGMSVKFATLTVLVFGIGNFFGMLIGGHGGEYLYRIDNRYPAVLAGLSALLGCVPFLVLLNQVDSTSSVWFLGPVAFVAGLSSAITGPIIKATLQNVTLPQARGQAFALFNTFDDFGRGLGPVFVAILIARLDGRTAAFNAGVLGWAVCGIVNLCVFFTVAQDEFKTQKIITESLGESSRPS